MRLIVFPLCILHCDICLQHWAAGSDGCIPFQPPTYMLLIVMEMHCVLEKKRSVFLIWSTTWESHESRIRRPNKSGRPHTQPIVGSAAICRRRSVIMQTLLPRVITSPPRSTVLPQSGLRFNATTMTMWANSTARDGDKRRTPASVKADSCSIRWNCRPANNEDVRTVSFARTCVQSAHRAYTSTATQ